MGRKAEFTETSIIEAGERLRADGQAVTGWGLRTQLGGGKPQRLIAVWRAATGEAEVEGGPMSTRALGTALEALRSGIDGLAGDAIERLRTGAAEAVAAALADRDKAIEEATRDASTAVDLLEGALERSRQVAQDATLARGHAEAIVEEARRAVGEARTEVDGLRHQVRTLEDDIAVAQERIRGMGERANAAEERERAALERAAAAEARLVELERRERAAVQRAEAAEARPTAIVGRRRGAPEPVPAVEAVLSEDGTADSS